MLTNKARIPHLRPPIRTPSLPRSRPPSRGHNRHGLALPAGRNCGISLGLSRCVPLSHKDRPQANSLNPSARSPNALLHPNILLLLPLRHLTLLLGENIFSKHLGRRIEESAFFYLGVCRDDYLVLGFCDVEGGEEGVGCEAGREESSGRGQAVKDYGGR